MIRDITIGQYYPTNSFIHRLDPRVKVLGTLLFLLSLFLQNCILGYALATLFLMIAVKVSKVPLKYILRGLKAVVFIMLFTVVMNLFFTANGNLLLSWGPIHITDQGIRTSVFMAVRLIYLIIGSSLMTFTTTPNSLTDGLEKLLHPLTRLKVPVHEVAMMMSIALRFIPILIEETDKIMKAQIARGADLDTGNLIQKTKAMVPILVPLFVSAFRRANELAMAMEARCYNGGAGRTKMKPLAYNAKDRFTLTGIILYVIAAILIGKFAAFRLWIF